MNDQDSIPAAPETKYAPDELILYGVALNDGKTSAASISSGANAQGREIRLKVEITSTTGKGTFVIAAISAYACEGHCYRMDKPKVLIFEQAAGGKHEPAVGCGFDKAKGYSMWRLRPSDDAFELDMGAGSLQTVVLDANLPARRAPSTYAANMQIAHRGGRLT